MSVQSEHFRLSPVRMPGNFSREGECCTIVAFSGIGWIAR